MPAITPSRLTAIYTAVNAYFMKGLGKASQAYQAYAHEQPSSAGVEEYPVQTVFGAMRELAGDPVISRSDLKKLVLKNRTFNRTQSIPMEDIADDVIGAHGMVFEEMGFQSEAHWGRLVAAALCDNMIWVDGKPFFTASRKLGGAKIDNTAAKDLTADSFLAARAKMMGYVASDGQSPLGLVADTLIVGPALEQTARKILEADLVSDGTTTVSNLCKGLAQIVVDQNLVGANANLWFVTCTTRAVKPVILQKREVGNLVRCDSPESECVKNRNEADYYIRHRGAATLTLPQLIIRGGVA